MDIAIQLRLFKGTKGTFEITLNGMLGLYRVTDSWISKCYMVLGILF